MNQNLAGAAALKTYIDNMLEANGLGWEEMFIPDNVYITGATDAIDAADKSDVQSPEGRQAAAAAALREAIDSTGQGDKVSNTNIAEAATAILTAVAKVRAQDNPPKQAAPAGMIATVTGAGLTPPTPPGAAQTDRQPPQPSEGNEEDIYPEIPPGMMPHEADDQSEEDGTDQQSPSGEASNE